MRQYSQISVHVPGDVLDLFLARVSELAAGEWRRDTAAEQAAGAIVPGMGVSYFYYVRADGPATDVVFLYRDNRLTLINILTTGHGITHAAHGRIAAAFWNAGMKQASKELGLTGVHTPVRDVKPEAGLPPGVAHALKLFALSANKSDGSSHPDDLDYWCKFLALSHAAGAEMDESRLGAYLEEKKFEERTVMMLSKEYTLGMALLKVYDALRKSKIAAPVQ